jgi:ADP-ribose pyrophosphatase
MVKIPDNAKCVFNGILYDVYQWEQEQFDGTKKTFEALRRLPTVKVIAILDGSVVLLDEEQPSLNNFLDIPGGRMDGYNDSELKTAKRELLEETGLDANNMELWRVLETSTKIDWPIHYYIAKDCKKIQEPELEAGEKVSMRLLSFDEFIEVTQKDDFRDRYLKHEVLKMINNKEKLEEFKKLILS